MTSSIPSIAIVIAIAIAVAAPLLSGCIVISTEKPTTRVVTAPAAQ